MTRLDVGAVIAAFDAQIAQAAALPQPHFFWLATGMALAMALFLYFGFRALIHARLIADLPTSRIASAAQGYLELEGNADLLPGPRVISPLTASPCAWWWYRVEKKVTRGSGSNRRTSWKTLVDARSDELFLLRDGSGECIVDPEGARVIPSLKRRWMGPNRQPGPPPTKRQWLQFGSYRYTEHLLQLGDALYALGYFRTQHGVQSFNEREALGDLLAEWKRDQTTLLQRFDADGDGQISLDEWEAVRRAALAEVRQRHIAQAVTPDLNILSRPPDRRPYLLSAVPQTLLQRRKQRRGWILIACGVLLFALLATVLQARLSLT